MARLLAASRDAEARGAGARRRDRHDDLGLSPGAHESPDRRAAGRRSASRRHNRAPLGEPPRVLRGHVGGAARGLLRRAGQLVLGGARAGLPARQLRRRGPDRGRSLPAGIDRSPAISRGRTVPAAGGDDRRSPSGLRRLRGAARVGIGRRAAGPAGGRSDVLHLGHHRLSEGRAQFAPAPRRRSSLPGNPDADVVGAPRPADRGRGAALRTWLPQRAVGVLLAAARCGPDGRHAAPLRSGGDARAHRPVRRDEPPPRTDAVHPHAEASGGDAGRVPRRLAGGCRARRGALPARSEAPDARLVGAEDHGVLRRNGGRFPDGDHRRGMAAEARQRRTRNADGRALHREGRRRARRAERAGPDLLQEPIRRRLPLSQDPKKTEAAHRGPGVGTLGDVGYLDEDGYLFMSDWKIDMIISGGVNIYPAEIESVLVTHPAVADAAVFGVPNEEFGEEVKAAVELAPGQAPSEALAEELVAHVRRHLAGYKAPRSIDFEQELPRAPTGKLMKRLLRDRYWQGTGRAI